MKQLLSLLLCFAFLNAQTFAKHELPGGGLNNSISGIYGGVMLPNKTVDGSGAPLPTANSLGLFSFVLPDSGFGAGAMIVFANGTVYDGTITAMGNPKTLKINAVLKATYNFTIITQANDGTLTNAEVTAQSNGTMEISVDNIVGFGTPDINGTAYLGISQGLVDSTTLNPILTEQTYFDVSGIQQTTSITFLDTQAVTIPQ